MKIKSSELPYWVNRYSGLLPLDALPYIDKYLTEVGKSVLVNGATFTRI